MSKKLLGTAKICAKSSISQASGGGDEVEDYHDHSQGDGKNSLYIQMKPNDAGNSPGPLLSCSSLHICLVRYAIEAILNGDCYLKKTTLFIHS